MRFRFLLVVPLSCVALSAFAELHVGLGSIAKERSSSMTMYQLKTFYAPKTNDQMYLPLDIADIKMNRVEDGYLSKSELLSKKDKLSVYLSQNAQARHFVGLYKQRVLAWSSGEAPKGMTVERALNIEALYPVLSIELQPNTTNLEMLKYFENRLNAKDFFMVKHWVDTGQPDEKKTVADIIVEMSNKNLMNTY